METQFIRPYLDNINNQQSAYVNVPCEDVWDDNYNLTKMREKLTTIEIDNGLLVIGEDFGVTVKYFVFEIACSDDNGEYGILIYYGSGTGGNLREMRHTYFNPYLFYIPVTTIESSFKKLRNYFDI